MRSDPAPPRAAAPTSHHLRLWWRRRGRPGAVGATFAVALLAAGLLLTLSSYASVPLASSSSGRRPALVGLTLVRRAEEMGARESLPTSIPFRFQYCGLRLLLTSI